MAERGSKKAVHFGAGNIGRGVIGPILTRNGYSVVFLDISQTLIDALRAEKSYIVEIAGSRIAEERIGNVDGLMTTGSEAIQAIADADVITTAVGSDILVKIAPVLAKGLREADFSRRRPIVIACENKVGASDLLAEYVAQNSADAAAKAVFVNCSIDAVVPLFEHPDLLRVRVEDYHEWLTDKTAYDADNLLRLNGMELVENLPAYVERKIYTLNTAHAITAWLSYLKGYSLIREGIADQSIRPIVAGAAAESGAGLCRAFGFDPKDHAVYRKKILKRFENPYIDDTVSRVGRQPLRKLGANDRVFAPLIRCAEYGLAYSNLALGAAAGLRFTDQGDRQALELREILKKQSVYQWTLNQLPERADRQAIAKTVRDAYLILEAGLPKLNQEAEA